MENKRHKESVDIIKKWMRANNIHTISGEYLDHISLTQMGKEYLPESLENSMLRKTVDSFQQLLIGLRESNPKLGWLEPLK